jgi:TonB family protein
MRTFLLLFLFANSLFAQKDSLPAGGEKTYELFDITKPPAYPGGEQAMLRFLAENIKYPALARENNIQGTVALTFVVDKDGSITDVQIVKDIGGGCGKESVRVVKAMPKWTPGEANGKPVKVRYTLPLRFRLDDDSPEPAPVIRQLDSATVWEGVRIATEQYFDEKNVKPSFKIKNKKKRAALVAALEGQFQVNVGEDEIKSLKRAGDLSNYIFQAQQGPAFFSKNNFQGKVERFATDRDDCDENFDCLNFIGSLVVPKGWKVTFFSQPDFKGEQLVVDASAGEVRISSFMKIDFSETISTTNKALNWRDEVRSVRFAKK